MDLGLENKVVVVTGGAKGIGEGITRSFAAEGAIPVVFSRNPEQASSLKAVLEASGQVCHCRAVELTNEAEVEAALDSTVKEFGRLDVIVNNAGVNDGVGLEEGPEAFENSLRTNLVQLFSMVHHGLDALKATRGNIINIGSKVATTGQGGTSAYAASKGGVNALTREWAVDLADAGIRVNAVIPAEVMTPLYEKFLAGMEDPEGMRKRITDRIPLERRFTTAREIADNDYNLNIPRYVDTFEEEEEIDLDAVKQEIETLEAELVDVRKKMAGYLEELGL
ncbi:MAG: SDR family oxidoreductase [Verrucomicrobiota bacterium]